MVSAITFTTPEGLTTEEKPFEGIAVHRFRHPTARMELCLLCGPWDWLMRVATQTKVRFVPPEGRAMTDADRELLAGLFVAAVQADLVLELAGAGRPAAQVAEDRKGRTTQGYVFASKALQSGSVTQGTSVVFDPAAMNAAIIGYRSAAEHAADVKNWSETILQSVAF